MKKHIRAFVSLLCAAALALGCVIAFSRMYLYVHYPTDILGGVIIGILSGVLGYKIIKLILKNRHIYIQGI